MNPAVISEIVDYIAAVSLPRPCPYTAESVLALLERGSSEMWEAYRIVTGSGTTFADYKEGRA